MTANTAILSINETEECGEGNEKRKAEYTVHLSTTAPLPGEEKGPLGSRPGDAGPQWELQSTQRALSGPRKKPAGWLGRPENAESRTWLLSGHWPIPTFPHQPRFGIPDS